MIDLLTTAGVQTTATTAAFTENGGAVTVAPQLTLADVDGTTAAGATVTLTNAQTGDVLSLQGQAGTSGTLAGGIGFSISGSTVTFSNVSLLANYQAALQLVQFNNTSVNPITTDRSFAFQIDDGGVVNNLANATATVTIGTVNHAPTTADTSASGARGWRCDCDRAVGQRHRWDGGIVHDHQPADERHTVDRRSWAEPGSIKPVDHGVRQRGDAVFHAGCQFQRGAQLPIRSN